MDGERQRQHGRPGGNDRPWGMVGPGEPFAPTAKIDFDVVMGAAETTSVEVEVELALTTVAAKSAVKKT